MILAKFHQLRTFLWTTRFLGVALLLASSSCTHCFQHSARPAVARTRLHRCGTFPKSNPKKNIFLAVEINGHTTEKVITRTEAFEQEEKWSKLREKIEEKDFVHETLVSGFLPHQPGQLSVLAIAIAPVWPFWQGKALSHRRNWQNRLAIEVNWTLFWVLFWVKCLFIGVESEKNWNSLWFHVWQHVLHGSETLCCHLSDITNSEWKFENLHVEKVAFSVCSKFETTHRNETNVFWCSFVFVRK